MTFSGIIRTVALLALATGVSAQQYTISTVAGGVLPPTPAKGTEISIGMTGPVATDAKGSIYFATLTSVFKLDPRGIVTHVAGTANVGYSGDGGLAVAARFRQIGGLAVALDGSVYIADTGNHRVRRVSPDGIITTVVGTGYHGGTDAGVPAAQASVSSPAGLALDSHGNLYIASNGVSRVIRIDTGGQASVFAGTRTAGFSGDGGLATEAELAMPSGLAVDAQDNLYIADTVNQRVRRVSTDGMIVTVAGNGGYGESGNGGPATDAAIGLVKAIAADQAGNLFIANSYSTRKITLDGTIMHESLLAPAGLAVDAQGQVFAVSTFNSCLFRLLPGDDVELLAGNGSSANVRDGDAAVASQVTVHDVALDREGNLYIADHVNHRVRRVSTKGIITTVAGDGSVMGTRFGLPATSTGLYTPRRIAVDGSGNIYVAAGYPQQVVKIAANGIITAVTAPGEAHSGDGGPASKATLGLVSDIAVDSVGNIYLADYSSHRVRKISTSGVITTVAGNGLNAYTGDGGSAANASVGAPMALTTDAAGNLYIAHQALLPDGWKVGVRRVTANGAISTVAGGGTEEPGEGRIATNVWFFGISDIASDIDGALLMLDIAGRLWRAAPGGTLVRLAGNGTDESSGDGGLAATAAFSMARGLAVAGDGGIYFGEWQAVRKLTPVKSGCAYGVSPTTLTAYYMDFSYPFEIETGAACEWTVTGTPSWIVPSALAGAGPQTISLRLSENNGPARNATITISGRPVTVTQHAGSIAGCTYALATTGEIVGMAAASGSIALAASSGCGWTATSTAPWLTISGADTGSGSATVRYRASANDSGAARSGIIVVGGRAFTVEQLAAASDTLVAVGSAAHVVSGGGWKTTLTLTNIGDKEARIRLQFWSSAGAPLALPVTSSQSGSGIVTASTVERVIAPGAILFVETAGTAAETLQGWAQITSDGQIRGHAVLTQRVEGGEHDAAIPVDSNSTASALVLAFDQTNGRQTGLAIANVLAQYAEVELLFRDESGAVIGGGKGFKTVQKLNLPPRGHAAFVLAAEYPQSANRHGTVEIIASQAGQIRAIGLQFNPGGTFISIPISIK